MVVDHLVLDDLHPDGLMVPSDWHHQRLDQVLRRLHAKDSEDRTLRLHPQSLLIGPGICDGH
jgi:hypothetical protein